MAWTITLDWRGEPEDSARLHATWNAGQADEFRFQERVSRTITVAEAQLMLERAEVARAEINSKKTWVNSLVSTLRTIWK